MNFLIFHSRRCLWLLLALGLSGCATAVHRTGDTAVTQVIVKENASRPTVVLIHGCGGTSPHEHWMKIFDANGLNTVLIDYINPRGFSTICDLNAPIHIDKVANDLNELLGWIQIQKWHSGNVSVMGFSFGGAIVNTLTDTDNLRAKGVPVDHISQLSRIISVYPLCAIGGLAEKSSVRTQVHFGLKDYWTPHAVCMTDRLDKSNYELVYYEDAMHGFDIPSSATHVNGNFRLQFNPSAFEQLQKNVIRFLK